MSKRAYSCQSIMFFVHFRRISYSFWLVGASSRWPRTTICKWMIWYVQKLNLEISPFHCSPALAHQVSVCSFSSIYYILYIIYYILYTIYHIIIKWLNLVLTAGTYLHSEQNVVKSGQISRKRGREGYPLLKNFQKTYFFMIAISYQIRCFLHLV